MKLHVIIISLLLALISAREAVPVESYILTLESQPLSIEKTLTDLQNVVKSAGGKITHEYSLIKGFSMEVPKTTAKSILKHLEMVASRARCKLNLEPDQEIHANSVHGL
ncbi:LAMI_0B00760g1_1 [Lachancea mirantina]|uniref:LAMI_0B00760g1_1 n=1 Tax=Lachancea mirantina TaxID=1230905 RepID=A0A1G4ITA0_9SACH|nr:LAMI_0B00760g1_1 [Lachancea mirantina]